MEKSKARETYDHHIHNTIKRCCGMNVDLNHIEARPSLAAFLMMAKNASGYEVNIHKSEYLLLFTRLVNTLGKRPDFETGASSEAIQYTPVITRLTDWFVGKACKAETAYKDRLRTLVQSVRDYNLPVPAEKIQEWDQSLALKGPKGNIKPILPDPDRWYPCALVDSRRYRRAPRNCE